MVKALNERLEKEGFISKLPNVANACFVKSYAVVNSSLATRKYKNYFTGDVSLDSIEALAESQHSPSFSLPPLKAAPAVVAAAAPAATKKQTKKAATASAKVDNKVLFLLPRFLFYSFTFLLFCHHWGGQMMREGLLRLRSIVILLFVAIATRKATCLRAEPRSAAAPCHCLHRRR